MNGDLGEPPGGWPEPFRSQVLENRDDDTTDDEELSEEDRAALNGEDRREALNRLMLPGPAKEHAAAKERWGDVSVVPTKAFFYGLEPGEELAVDLEPGVRLYIELEAVTDSDESGTRTLLVSLNSQLRQVDALDRSLEPETPAREKADPEEDGHVAAPMTGVATLAVEEGEQVSEGQQVGTVEAMKMEGSIRAPMQGTVERLAIDSGTDVESGDLLLEIEPG